MKVIDKDTTLKALRIAKQRFLDDGRTVNAVDTARVIQIIEDLPELTISDEVNCGRCYQYDAMKKRCLHRNGLNGRVLPGFFCSYASPTREGANEGEECDDDFSEFDEEGEG